MIDDHCALKAHAHTLNRVPECLAEDSSRVDFVEAFRWKGPRQKTLTTGERVARGKLRTKQNVAALSQDWQCLRPQLLVDTAYHVGWLERLFWFQRVGGNGLLESLS